jgi:hypothetical protein
MSLAGHLKMRGWPSRPKGAALWSVEVVAAKEIGRETVQYVSNVYKYYLAYKMLTEKNAHRVAAVKAAKAQQITK